MFPYSVSLMIFAVSLASLAISQTLMKWRFIKLNPGQDGAADKLDFIASALSDGWLWFAGILVIVSAVSWYTALSRLPLSLMLPLAGVVSPVVVIIAHLFLKEPLNGGQMGAIAMIFVGIAWLGYQQ